MTIPDRTYELQLLRERVESDRADFLVVYGRRRVGKTELLHRLAADVRSLVFEGTETTETDQLAAFAADLALASGSDPEQAPPLASWRAALDRLTEFVGDRRTLVVLDEFQFLARQSQGLESLINVWWRKSGRHLPITFIVSGSEVSFLEDEVLAGTMYGRRTGQLKLEPFTVADAALSTPATTSRTASGRTWSAAASPITVLWCESPVLQGGDETPYRCAGRCRCSRYWPMIDRGAPPREAAKYDGDQKCPCMIARLTRPVNSYRSRRAETPLSEPASLETDTFGG